MLCQMPIVEKLAKIRASIVAPSLSPAGTARLAMGRSIVKATCPGTRPAKIRSTSCRDPTCGTPRGSGIATKAGRLSHSLPRAYVTQAPMLGKPSTREPVLIWFSPGPCVLVFAVIEWMKHISSASSARFGSRSEIILPLCPRGLNVQGLLIRLPLLPWKVTSLSTPGIGVSCAFDQLGLVIPRVEVAARARAKDHQHPLCPRRKMRRARRTAPRNGWPAGSAPLRQPAIPRQQAGQCNAAEPTGGVREKITPIEQAKTGG